MNYKIEGIIRRNRSRFIIFILLWIFAVVFLIMPLNCSIVDSTINGVFQLGEFFGKFTNYITHPFSIIGKSFLPSYIGNFFKIFLPFNIFYLIFMFIGLFRTAPKNEFSDIEHGSSDWSKNGEQYTVLSNKKGIILAENNYLPVDKRGNVNVLVVGRIWIW